MENLSFGLLSRSVSYETAEMLYKNAIQGYKDAIEASNTLKTAINKTVKGMIANESKKI